MYSDSLRNQCFDGSVCSRLEQKFGDERGLHLERRVLLEGRRGGAKDHITDLNVELVMMCTDENDIEELTGKNGLLCWQEYDKDPGGFKKLMWYENYEKNQLLGFLLRGPYVEEKVMMVSRTDIQAQE